MTDPTGPTLDDLRTHLDAAVSPFHAVAHLAARFDAAGFVALDEHDAWGEIPERGYVVRDGAMIAWRLPADRAGGGTGTGFRLVGAHTDSPGLRVKPRPDTGAHGWRQLGVEVYGGILPNSWLDRDLGVAGRLVFPDGSRALVDVATPIARVPQLAIHLDREIGERGLQLDRQQHLTPVWGVGNPDPGEFAAWIGGQVGREPASWWELCLYDVQPAAVLGADGSLLASGRLDNQLSCWAAASALTRVGEVSAPAVVVLNDHEEVGSASTTGASGAFLEQVLERLTTARGGDRDAHLRALAASSCISADNAHAVHPNYPERHEPGHRPVVNAGPAIKVNANQRYATSAATAVAFEAACRVADVPWQVFVSRNNMPCGSTIGPLTATRLGIPTVDVGVPQLSMHSARELCGVDDPGFLERALVAHFAAPAD